MSSSPAPSDRHAHVAATEREAELEQALEHLLGWPLSGAGRELEALRELLAENKRLRAKPRAMPDSLAKVEVSVLNVPAFREFVERVQSFVQEYAWHTRDCAAIDADGEWHLITSPACTCGYDEALVALVPPEMP